MRKAKEKRKTRETDIEVSVNLDGNGDADIKTPYGFFDHMLNQLSRHSGIDMRIRAGGDVEVDAHHSVEDTASVLGKAIDKALGERKGIERYGWAMLAMDEARCDTAVDLGGRSFLVYNVDYPVPWDPKGDFDYSLIKEFMYSFARALRATLHINLAYGENNHHIAESVFKSLAKSIGKAVKVSGKGLPSTKGVI